MSILDADITFEEVSAPVNGWCSSGHKAPELFKRAGADSIEEPIRFFIVKRNNISEIYCECCIIIANYIARSKKQAST